MHYCFAIAASDYSRLNKIRYRFSNYASIFSSVFYFRKHEKLIRITDKITSTTVSLLIKNENSIPAKMRIEQR